MQLILASKSPRRKELLKKISSDFTVSASSIDESKIEAKSPVKFALTAAQLKAKDVGDKNPDAVVIGADTIVVLGDKIFGKPKDHEEAKRVLRELSGKEHKVITGLALYNGRSKNMIFSLETTVVTFKELSEHNIDEYLKQVEVKDKAGAYGIQEFGDSLVEKIIGDYDNVVGLPVAKLKSMLEDFDRLLRKV